MSKTFYRAVRAEDVLAAVQLHITARNDMWRRNGRSVAPSDVESDVKGYRHILNTGIFEVAEQDGQIVGVANAVVRDQIWFLASFWVHPDLQNQHIGGPMLRRVWDQGAPRGADIHCVWASVDPTAMATYMKFGMLPGCQILNFGAVADEARLPAKPDGYELQPLTWQAAGDIDEVVRATRRAIDHRFWLDDPTRQGRLVVRGRTPVGYYYTTPDGGVLPAAWLDPADGEAVLTLACREGLDRAEAASLRALGCNHLAIRFALRCGFRLKGFSHFLTTRTFGKLDQYAPSGPLLL